ncbi:hypothetical protein QUB63_24745 [Microcoleus sp. ARI1-B5]|uniref:hypothetical protein n=1 Tax=unclassified Microcoleus TaxID=2642155 RepID=UPI002FD189EF
MESDFGGTMYEFDDLTDKLLEVPVVKLPLVGTKEGIAKYLASLELMDCVWESDGQYYSCDAKGEFAYFLTNIRYVPPQAFREDELQVFFWDSLLRICGIEVFDRNTIQYLH